MPRSRGGRSAPARRPSAPAAPAPRPTGNQQQSRAMTTTAQRPAGQAQTQAGAQQQQGKSPGLFGQMASTAAGVAVGSSIGHALGGLFGGGASQQQAAEDPALAAGQSNAYAQPMDQGFYNTDVGGNVNSAAFAGDAAAGPCGVDAQTFRKCMDDHRGDLTVCGWYLDQLKACQQAARPY